MRRQAFLGLQFGAAKILLVVGVALCLVLTVRADDRSDAANQFAHAVKLRATLEGHVEKDRTLADYKQTVLAYHKVYLITPHADDATAALTAETELYRDMGRLFDPRYFQSAIDACNFMLKQYPESRYGGQAMLSVAQIQKDDLLKPDDAEASYRDYLKRFPHSEKSEIARAALKAIAAERPQNPVQTAQNSAQAIASDQKAPRLQTTGPAGEGSS
jgi:hypothetical protein